MNFRVLLLLCGLGIFAAGCASVPARPPTDSSQETLQGLCRRYNMNCRWDGTSQAVTMSYKGRQIQAMAGSNMVVVNGDRVALSAPLRRRHGAVVVPQDFVQIVIGSEAEPEVPYFPDVGGKYLRRVVIDAGHGGKDPGASGVSGTDEKDITLDIAQRLQKAFEATGVQTVMTRDDDRFITLQGRTEIASDPGVDLFISIHANAHKSRSARGIEVYYCEALNAQDRVEDGRKGNEAKMCRLLKMNNESRDLRGIVSDMLHTGKTSLSPGLADAVARGICRELSGTMRGSKSARYYVLRNTLVPAILIEVGFLSHPREEALLKTPAYRQKIADAIAKNVLESFYGHGM